MKKFKKKPKSIKRSHQKTILKRPLWLAPLLIGGFASGVYADGKDIFGLSWGKKPKGMRASSMVCSMELR
ncbi:hypothetical protein JP0181_00650 [Helicobacter pylori]|nr:hypothetical protein [Helicobacter pylori]EJB16959.1 putative vacuolating cytotoxin (VacA)-like protein [Helicobacter pylori CPY1124]EJB20458.1 putative vacuolating cytotoxin (VacA)-like protein [Helicobacter pylori CPY3281]GHP34707.1 hypothetical protein JP0040_03960 [Helicobacter pylori]GHQ61312.1 hypothetical protein JP0074_01630 [Helicobacter pylori]GHS49715.1 hypothetical protein JP0128_01640 [Helicobacter pylori]